LKILKGKSVVVHRRNTDTTTAMTNMTKRQTETKD